MLCALGFRSLIFNRRWPSHPLNKRYAVLKVDGSSTSLVSVNLDALSNLPPDWSLQPNHILCRVLSLKRSLFDTHVPPVLVHRCLVASYPYVSTNDHPPQTRRSPPSTCSPAKRLYLLAPPSNTTTPPVHNPAPPCGIPQTYLSDPAGVWLTSALRASQHGPCPWKISKMSVQVLTLHLWVRSGL
ncbi:hypothetical protein F2Q69_00033142 [Brassica cretica]|uniref:Uncharacterized protein n=1 Tax=Brassica cretica TaxID=69181 RepID=A0A8S9SL16_BRACR|nr:hypothetical protein F2Q69_00033142 [Brassica cretica]